MSSAKLGKPRPRPRTPAWNAKIAAARKRQKCGPMSAEQGAAVAAASARRAARAKMSGAVARGVDIGIRRLVVDLNAAGFATDSSCQGRTSEADYAAERHTEHAFISFSEPLQRAVRRRAEALGLEV